MEAGLTPDSLKQFLHDIKILSLPAKKKREIVVRTIQRIKDKSVSNAANQRSPEGQGWKARKNGTTKMLRRIAKLANSKADNDTKARLFYKVKKTGEIAQEHQEGLDHHFKKGDFNSRNEGAASTDPATPRQAKKLRDLGYSVRVGTKKGKKWKRLSIKEIRQSLNRDRAGLIIRKMTSHGESQRLTEWIIPTEKRPFLDDREVENAKIMTDILKDYLKQNDL